MILNNQNFVYIKDRELSLTECFAQKEYVYPKRIYEGLEFFIDIDTFTLENTWVQNEFSIDFRKISEMFCPHGSTYISTATHETEEILKKLWELYDFPASFAVIQMIRSLYSQYYKIWRLSLILRPALSLLNLRLILLKRSKISSPQT